MNRGDGAGAKPKKKATSAKENLDEYFVPGEEGGDGKKPQKKKMSIERIYQKKTQLEHILLRPDTYIGSVETVTQVQVNTFFSFSILVLTIYMTISCTLQLLDMYCLRSIE